MDLQKYKNHLFQNIKNKLSEWLYLERNEKVPAQEVYRFLHSIKGTSGTLQLDGLMQLSEELLNKLNKESEKEWDKIELKNFLFALIELTYKYENFDELVILDEPVDNSSAPL